MLEIMVALVLIGLLILPAVGILVHDLALSQVNLYQVAADQVAQDTMEALACEGYNGYPLSTFWNKGLQTDYPSMSISVSGQTVQLTPQWQVDTTGVSAWPPPQNGQPPGLLQLTVSVTYSYNGQHTVQVVTYVGNSS